MALKAAGISLSPYYAQVLRLSENVQALTGIPGKCIDNNGEDMEYNCLMKNDRLDKLFDPE